jgi:hypothetical protein
MPFVAARVNRHHPRYRSRWILATIAAAIMSATALGQQLVPGRNVNMVSGTRWPDGDPYLQRQNEPSVAGSTRNPLHLLAGANDYRTVDIPFVNNADETGDAWLGVFKSLDGGQRWRTSLLPGYPQDTSAAGLASPLKGYSAGADPVVRAGTNGLFYYTGLVFDRTQTGDGRSAIFAARFIDNNDREAGDPIKYLGTTLVASSPGGANGAFLDKPWMAVDIPRGRAGTCRIRTSDVDPLTGQPRSIVQTVPAGAAYVVYTAFTRDAQGERADIFFTRSIDCGVTWTPPVRVNRLQDRVNQGATMAVDPTNGDVFIAWRQFAAAPNLPGDGLMIARYDTVTRRVLPPWLVRRLSSSKLVNFLQRLLERRRLGGSRSIGDELQSFDQATTGINEAISFRTNAYPTMAIDANGRIYVAWTERGFGTARPSPTDGDARIVMSTSAGGLLWSAPRPIADETANGGVPIPGHQIMPSLTIGGGRLVLVYYDLRDDVSQTFSGFAGDQDAILSANRRRTLDLRASQGSLGASPVFDNSVRVSDYLMKQVITPSGTLAQQQMQYNAPNLPMFQLGTAPFMGDYVDVTTAPVFVASSNGRWSYNLNGPSAFHAVWTDNRDVRQPRYDLNGDGNPWNDYTAPTARAGVSPSIFDPTTTLPACTPENSGARNQNVYTARLSTGLIAGAPGNSKPLSPTLPRAFSVFAQNTTAVTKRFRLTIDSQPLGGRASFDQFSAKPVVSLDVTTLPRSLAARTVYVTSTQSDAQIPVTVREINGIGGGFVTGGLSDRVVLNPDISNPDISNPDISNPDISNPDISNAEVYNPDISNPDISNPDISNPDISNPDISNPDISNPDISNPDISNPDISNVVVANPDISNPDISNPDISNPDISNPDISNPDISNPDISNTTLTDVTWEITNDGNTAASFNVNLFLAQASAKICQAGQSPGASDCIATQLIMHKAYITPTTTACVLQVQTQNVLIANIPNPRFVTPGQSAATANDPSEHNATLWLGPGETARITLRIADPDINDNASFGNATIDPVFFPTTSGGGGALTPFITQQAVNTADVGNGGAITRYPASVFFVQQPVTTPLGFPIAPAVTVQVRDQLGAPLANAAVTMALVNPAPGGAAVAGGESTLTDANGVASFPALLVDRAGSGYQLEVSVIDATTTASISNRSLLFDVPLAVVNTSDAGPGSLRFAIDQANLTVGARETVTFAIPGAGPHTIAPQTDLPAITDSVVIDGRTQAGYAARTPAVIVSGASIGSPSSPALLDVTADHTEIDGLTIRGFAGAGIRIRGGGASILGNVISGNSGAGVLIEGGSGNRVVDNVIGLSPGGVLPPVPNAIGIRIVDHTGAPAADTVIDGNIVSGNTSVGIVLSAAGGGPVDTVITRNVVGLDASGFVMAGNSNLSDRLGGVLVEAGPGTTIGAAGSANLIGGNFGPGITVGLLSQASPASGVTIVGNVIGVNGAFSLGNTGGGIALRNASANLIGGDDTMANAGTENVIWYNGGAGVSVQGAASTGNSVRFNSLTGNAGLGIDLGGDGLVNANDADDFDTGPNGLQNRPVLTSVLNNVVPGVTRVSGTLNGLAGTTFRLQVYSSASCDPSGFGEGERHEFTFSVTPLAGSSTINFVQDVIGPAGPIAVGRVVTVTAMALNGVDAGSSSEFSNCAVVANAPAAAITSVTPSPVGSNSSWGQMVVVRGVGLPATSASDVRYIQGTTNVPAHYVFSADATLVIARTPIGLAAGPATLRLTNGVVSLDAPIAISSTPGAPVLASVRSTCAGSDISTVAAGDLVYVLADGVDTSGTTFIWTRTSDSTQLTSSTNFTTGGPGSVCTQTTAPAGLTSGAWTLQIRTQVGFATSPPSNAIGVNIPTPAPPTGGLVSLWHADGDAADASGANTGLLQNGATFGQGIIGQAFSFTNPTGTSANQHVSVADHPTLQMTDTLTMAAWIFPVSGGNYTNFQGAIGEGGIIVNKEDAYEMARFADGSIRWAFFNSTPGWVWVDSGAIAPLNTWSHVAVTYDNGLVKTYLNGTLVHTYNGTGTLLTSTTELRIGGRQLTDLQSGFLQNFDGRIDEVFIYNQALSAVEMLQLYNAGLNGGS